MRLTIELDHEPDGAWIAEVPELPGTFASAATGAEAVTAVRALAMRVLADRVVRGDAEVDVLDAVAFVAPVPPDPE
jgi:predicted RNase H-like HicB family nuclease